MPLTAGAVIDAARDEHAAFDRARHPDKGALRFLSRTVRRLHPRIHALDPTALATTEEIDLPLEDFESGVELPEHRVVSGVTATPTDVNSAPVDVTLLPYLLRNDRQAPFASAWVRGGRLFLAGDASRWRNIGRLTVDLLTTPEELTQLSDEVALPDAAEAMLVAHVAAYFEGRVPGMGDRKAAIAEATERQYLDEIASRLAAQTFFVRDVLGGY